MTDDRVDEQFKVRTDFNLQTSEVLYVTYCTTS